MGYSERQRNGIADGVRRGLRAALAIGTSGNPALSLEPPVPPRRTRDADLPAVGPSMGEIIAAGAIAPILASLDAYRAAEERSVHTNLALMLALGQTTREELEARLEASFDRNFDCDLGGIEIRFDPFWQPMTRRRRRRLRGGKTQSSRLTFKPWDPAGLIRVARGAATLNVT